MSSKASHPLQRRALLMSVYEGLFHALMLGAAESYLGALAVELGHRDVALAVLSSAPLFFGFAAQLFAGPAVSWLGSRKRLVVVGSVVQALSHLGFAYIAWTGSQSFFAFLVVKVLYFAAGLMIAPAWGAWMSTLVEGRAREQYFARRAAVVQLMLLLSFVSAGLLLFGAQTASVSALWMFALLNLFGLTARLLSVTCLALQPDPMQEAVSAKSWIRLRDAVKGSNWKIASYVAVLFFGAHTAVPFFTPYMLRELRMDYATYATLIAVPIAVRALCSPFLFVAAQRVGMRALFITSTGLIAVVALLWALFASFEALFLAQILSGLAWGMFEYASYQLLLQSSPEATRVEFLSLANAMAGAAQLSGALLGGILLMTDAIGYQAVFLLSAGARALPVAFAFAVLPKRLPTIARLVTRVVSVRPSGGTVERPIVTRETDKHE